MINIIIINDSDKVQHCRKNSCDIVKCIHDIGEVKKL